MEGLKFDDDQLQSPEQTRHQSQIAQLELIAEELRQIRSVITFIAFAILFAFFLLGYYFLSQ